MSLMQGFMLIISIKGIPGLDLVLNVGKFVMVDNTKRVTSIR